MVLTAWSFLEGIFFDALHTCHQHVEHPLYRLIVAYAVGIELCFPVNSGALTLVIRFHLYRPYPSASLLIVPPSLSIRVRKVSLPSWLSLQSATRECQSFIAQKSPAKAHIA